MSDNSPLKYVKYVYDSVHGYIGLTEDELAIVDSSLFQRLHNIKHLGTAYLVYPGATHTRFAHSLGTMFVMGKLAQRLVELGEIDDIEEIEKLRLAALLHDIGHFPFSHILEVPIKETSKGREGSHENFSNYLITNTGLREKFERYDPMEIGSIINKKYTKNDLYSLLISSDLDVDRIDYLLRDSHETGVSYGLIDSDRLIRTIIINKEKNCLAVEDKGRQALENFLLSRYHMYQTVYYHKTVVAFSIILQRIYKILMEKGIAYTYEDLLDLSDEQIYSFNDFYLWKLITEYQNDKTILGDFIKRYKYRQPLKMIKEIHALSISGSKTPEYSRLELIELPVQMEALIKQSGVSEEWIFYFNPKPLEILSDAESEKAIYIIKPEMPPIPVAKDPTSVISKLYESGYLSARVYTKREHENALRQGLKNCFGI